MLNPVSVSKPKPNPAPKVLLQAKKEATTQTLEGRAAYEKGPWDKGHWANRK